MKSFPIYLTASSPSILTMWNTNTQAWRLKLGEAELEKGWKWGWLCLLRLSQLAQEFERDVTEMLLFFNCWSKLSDVWQLMSRVEVEFSELVMSWESELSEIKIGWVHVCEVEWWCGRSFICSKPNINILTNPQITDKTHTTNIKQTNTTQYRHKKYLKLTQKLIISPP